jgi:hypothetical protein
MINKTITTSAKALFICWPLVFLAGFPDAATDLYSANVLAFVFANRQFAGVDLLASHRSAGAVLRVAGPGARGIGRAAGHSLASSAEVARARWQAKKACL